MTAPTGAGVTAQDAIYAALAGDATFAAWLGATVGDARIYEVLAPTGKTLATEDGTPTPYVTLQGGTETSLDGLGVRAFDVGLTVRVWVPGTNERLAKIGAGHVRRILDGRALALAGHATLSCLCGTTRAQTDADGQATQAMTDVRLHAEATT